MLYLVTRHSQYVLTDYMNTKASVTYTNVYQPMGREAILSDSRNSGLHGDITTCMFILCSALLEDS